jgi:hypothetical protein
VSRLFDREGGVSDASVTPDGARLHCKRVKFLSINGMVRRLYFTAGEV